MKEKSLREKLVDKLWLDGGFTFHLTQDPPRAGYMVGVESISIKPENEPLTTEELERAILTMVADENLYLGGWRNNKLDYYDLSRHFSDKYSALEYGRKHGEIAIWDCENEEEIQCE